MDSETGMLLPTNVGMLLFGRDPQWRIPQSEIVCVRYADTIGVRKLLKPTYNWLSRIFRAGGVA